MTIAGDAAAAAVVVVDVAQYEEGRRQAHSGRDLLQGGSEQGEGARRRM